MRVEIESRENEERMKIDIESEILKYERVVTVRYCEILILFGLSSTGRSLMGLNTEAISIF